MIENDKNPTTDSMTGSPEKTRAKRRVFGKSLHGFFAPSMTLKLTPEACMILTSLMNKTNHDAEEVFIKSLFLDKAAVDAEQEGKKMVILDADGDIDQEITGL